MPVTPKMSFFEPKAVKGKVSLFLSRLASKVGFQLGAWNGWRQINFAYAPKG